MGGWMRSKDHENLKWRKRLPLDLTIRGEGSWVGKNNLKISVKIFGGLIYYTDL